METDGFPLKESYWHVGEKYKEIQSNLMTYMNGEGLVKNACVDRLDTPRLVGTNAKFCRTAMKGLATWTPHNNPDETSIYPYIKTASNGWHPEMPQPVYDGMDLIPYVHKIPDDHVDVHAILLATTYPAPDLDQSWNDGDRRSLMESMHAGMKNVNDGFAESKRRRLNSMKVSESQPQTKASLRISTVSKDIDMGQSRRRTDITPGIGWGYDQKFGGGYCDGSSNSKCSRQPTQKCLLYSHNDDRSVLYGDGLSGWLVIDMPKMEEGYILARMEYWHPRGNWDLTKEWTEVNNGEVINSEGGRSLGKVTEFPEDVKVEWAINGKIVLTWDLDDIKELRLEVQHNIAFYPIIDDKTVAGGMKDVELALRISSQIDPRLAGMGLTHLYYA